MKYLVLIICAFSGLSQAKDLQSCGNTTIEQLIAGPRHGSLLRLKNNECGLTGYVCIDLEGQYSSAEKGKAAYSFALAAYMAKKGVNITVDLDVKSCGGNFPVVEDIRTQ